ITPQVADIKTYIHSLYHEKTEPDVNPERPLVIYMADHGDIGTFRVNHGFEILNAQDLDSWLDDLQTQTSCPVYIIIEACYSGTFTSYLLPDATQKRVIITSTGNYVARYEADGRKSFSQYLFNGLSQGYSLKKSFYEATAAMKNKYIFNGQIPVLFDGNNGDIAQSSHIGGSFLIGDILPEIVSHTPNQSISAEAFDLYVDISHVKGINHVWVSIMPPNFHLPESSQNFETPIIKLPTLDLHDNS
ncbi:Peptidase C13, legumain, partial [Candidatus Magnetomorum sp. HK-1]